MLNFIGFLITIISTHNLFSISLYTAEKVPVGNITKKLIASFLPKNPVVVEAGAYDGADSLEMAKLWPKGMIHAFEPIPDVFQRLEQRTRRQGNIVRYPYALGNKTEKNIMYVSYASYQKEAAASSSLLVPKDHLQAYTHISFPETIEVEILTFDDWAAKYNISHVDLLWLDMQGSELDMLRASSQMLSTVKVIFTEVSHREMYEGIPLYEEVKEWLETQGFVAIMQDNIDPKMNNVLFVREELLPSRKIKHI